MNIISGALELRKKTVLQVMTHLEDAFMLSDDTILDFETVSEIMKSGFSRIPVYENERHNVKKLLFIKDLALIDPDDNTPLRTLCEFYQNACSYVYEDVTLDVIFKQFKTGQQGHMAFVQRVNNEGDGDPFYETVGLITLEDVIEELIQAEIVDETDVYTDNRNKKKRKVMSRKHDFTIFAAERRDIQRIHISPQLTLATFQYLSTSKELQRAFRVFFCIFLFSRLGIPPFSVLLLSPFQQIAKNSLSICLQFRRYRCIQTGQYIRDNSTSFT